MLKHACVPVEREAAQREGERGVGVEREEEQERDGQEEQDEEHQVVGPEPARRAPERVAACLRDGRHGSTNRRTSDRTTVRATATARRGHEHDDREHRPERPVRRLREEVLDDVAVHGPAGAADEVSGVTYSPTVGMKTRKKAAMTPGRLSGSVTRRNCCSRARVQVGGGVEQRRIDPLEGGVDRQRRERDPDVDEGDGHRDAVVEQSRRAGSSIRPLPDQERVDDALLAEHQLPGHDPQQVARPERDEQQDQDRAARDARPGRPGSRRPGRRAPSRRRRRSRPCRRRVRSSRR